MVVPVRLALAFFGAVGERRPARLILPAFRLWSWVTASAGVRNATVFAAGLARDDGALEAGPDTLVPAGGA